MKKIEKNLMYLAFLFIFASVSFQACDTPAPRVILNPDKDSYSPVGTTITWTADYNGDDSQDQMYRFTITSTDNKIAILRDYNKDNTFKWTPVDEGTYNVKVIAMNKLTYDNIEANTSFIIISALNDLNPKVKSTGHPLVALYYSPPVSADEMRIRFKSLSENDWHTTNWKECDPGKSVNFIVAGMRQLKTYEMVREIKKDCVTSILPETLKHTTGLPLLSFQDLNIIDEAASGRNIEQGIILHSTILEQTGVGCPVATDLEGNVLWYYGDVNNIFNAGTMAGRPTANGTFLFDINEMDGSLKRGQILREIDLLGNTVMETSIWSVNKQLQSLGHDTVNCFHHDSMRLENGHTLLIASTEKIVVDMQGDGPVDILGDMIIDLDENWNVSWVWNSFEHLNLERAAVLGEVYGDGAFSPGGPIYLDDEVNDWTHTNTCTYSPSDNNIIISFRNQDWCIKVDYNDGTGSGEILWRLGNDGNFNIDSDDVYPWFSHQHQIMVYNNNEYVVYDNGNTRYNLNGESGNSRGQAYLLDEQNMTAELILNVDLGFYSSFLGSAQKLSNGNYFFLSGAIDPLLGEDNPLGAYSRMYEVTPDGSIVYILESGAATYRAYRLKSLYEGLWE